MSYERKLNELHLELPLPPQPLATYVPAVQAGDLLFLSGVLPMRDGQLAFSGKLGRDLTVEQGMEAARLALLNALAIAKQELGTFGPYCTRREGRRACGVGGRFCAAAPSPQRG